MLLMSLDAARPAGVTLQTIQPLFDLFTQTILDPKTTLSANEQAHLFIDLLIYPNENTLHSHRKNILVSRQFGEVIVRASEYITVFDGICRAFSERERENLLANVDMLVDFQVRRRKGEFFTPHLIAQQADEYLQSALGHDYKTQYVVWDCAWGTGNLTRQNTYTTLYVSTLESCDLAAAERMGINPEATKFQFDFLNDSLDRLPAGLLKAMREKCPLVFFINPPYGTANNLGHQEGDHKAGIAATRVGGQMKAAQWGKAAQQLYAQFLFRIQQIKGEFDLTDVTVGLFSPTLLFTGPSFKTFRERFLAQFAFQRGFVSNAKLFSNVAGEWSVAFSIFNAYTMGEQPSHFLFDVMELDVETNVLTHVREKALYNCDGVMSLSEWVREPVKLQATYDSPQLTSALAWKQSGQGRLAAGALGYLTTVANSVYKNKEDVFLTTTCTAMAHGVSVLPINFDRVVVLFAVRKLIQRDWLNADSEYLVPSNIPVSFVADCLIYSLFHGKSQQSSLRQIPYKGQSWDIRNEFFWMSRKEIVALAEQYGVESVGQDAAGDDDRYVYSLLYGQSAWVERLSPDAHAVLNKAAELVRTTFLFRNQWLTEHPEWHLTAWDAGWYQIRQGIKKQTPNLLASFSQQYNELGNVLRPQVYDLGFLNR